MKQSAALKSWLDHPSKKVRESFARALERAEKSSKGVAGVAVGRRRLELKKAAGGAWSVFDPKSGDEAHHSKATKRVRKARVINDETPAQFKRRMAREIDRDSRKKARDAQKQRVKDVRAKAKAARLERARELEQSRDQCRKELEQSRATPKQPGRRIAVAKTKVGCATRTAAIEETIGGKLEEIHSMLKKLQSEHAPRRRRTTSSAKPKARTKERREERDDAIRSELERRGLHHLAPVWEQKKKTPTLRDLPFDRAIERFLEQVEEDPQALDFAHERAAAVDPGDVACDQAQYFARQGDPDAAAFAAEHCDDRGRARRASPASRTLSMFAGIAPPPAPPKERAARKPPEKRGPLRGQQTLSVGRLGRSVLEKIPF